MRKTLVHESIATKAKLRQFTQSIVPYSLLIFALLFYTFLSRKIGLGIYDGAPDESMRALLPKCIINGNLLPSGYDNCAIFADGNWSYAFYPQFLGSYLSALFMTIARFLGMSSSSIFMSGRLASVTFSAISLLCVGKSAEIIFKRNRFKYLLSASAIVLMGFWPQYAFLSSYMNNDIVAFSGVSIMIYSLVSGTSRNWDIRNGLIFAIGIIFAALGYWNSYGFILVAILLFIMTVIMQNHDGLSKAMKLISIVGAAAAIVILPFFIMNIIRYNDLLGMSTFKMRYHQWLDAGGNVLQHPWTTGKRELLFKSNFVHDTTVSFIGNLGAMAIPLGDLNCLFYIAIVFTGFGLFLSSTKRYYHNKQFLMLTCGSVIASFITIYLHLYYVVATDYQAQGRYVIYLLVPIVVMVIVGLGNSFEFRSPASRVILLCLIIFYIILCIQFFSQSANMYQWNGVSIYD